MKLNKALIQRLRCLSDAELWCEIRAIATKYGICLPENAPGSEQLAKVRDALDIGEVNMGDAMRIVNEYKRGQKQ